MTIAITGSKTLRASRETVWACLNDADCLRLCMPGCRSLTRISADTYKLSVAVSLGPVNLAFNGTVAIAASERPSTMTLTGRGEGGLAGHAGGTAHLVLTETPSGVRLAYAIEAEPHGPLAALGTLFIGGVAKTLTDRFVSTLAAVVSDLCRGATIAQARRRIEG